MTLIPPAFLDLIRPRDWLSKKAISSTPGLLSQDSILSERISEISRLDVQAVLRN